MSDILIAGFGNVGKNIYNEFKKLSPVIYDKYLELDLREKAEYKFTFICVDTPKTKDSNCDLTEIYSVLHDVDSEYYILKSTVLPGITETIKELTNKRIVFSPEYYGTTQHCNNYSFDFTILGGEKEDCIAVQQMMQQVYDARHTFHITNARTAELVKYMENSWLATKVSFCNQFYEIASTIDIPYEEVRELFILDPRVNPDHTFVYRDKPYWDSHCLNKDVNAIANQFDAELLKAVIVFNEKQKGKKT